MHPIHSFPYIKRFTNYFMKIGLINSDSDFNTQMYKNKYSIKIEK